MADPKPHPAHSGHAEALGFPGEPAKKSRAFQAYLDTCVTCGACTDKCRCFLGAGDPRNMPVARPDPLRSVAALSSAGIFRDWWGRAT